MPPRNPTRPISPDRLYPLSVAMRHLGWSSATLRRARNNGLQSWQFGRHSYVTGQELIRVITKCGRKKSSLDPMENPRQRWWNSDAGGGKNDAVFYKLLT